jgi:hypothetical protein
MLLELAFLHAYLAASESRYSQAFIRRVEVRPTSSISKSEILSEVRLAGQKCEHCPLHVTIANNLATQVLDLPSRGGIAAFTKRIYSQALSRLPELYAAEGIRAPAGEVIRIRRGQELSRIVVRGSDPLRIRTQRSRNSEIVYVVHDLKGLFFFVKVDRQTSEAGASEIATAVRKQFGIDSFTLVLRTDTWFQAWESYPILNLWEEPSTASPPDFPTHANEVVCQSTPSSISCHTF